MDAPSLAELTNVLNLAHVGSKGAKKYESTLKRMSLWLADLEGIQGTQDALVRFAVKTAEKELPNFEGMLALSTSHIEKSTDYRLGQGLPITMYPHGGHGYLIVVPSDDEMWETVAAKSNNGEIPTDLHECMAHARKCGCCWLLLDGDAGEIDGLTTYEW